MSDVTASVEQGKLQGKIGKDVKDDIYYSFQGIPYAKPPLGKLRFKDPELPEPWTGIRDATKEGGICYGFDFITSKHVGAEDCLYLNVFTKNIKPKKLKPVMLWIHGGGFTMGSGSESVYGPGYLLTEDIVLVTCNYRVGILGFTASDNPDLGVSGNAGLKDLVMVLKWIQKNVSNLGGDPNNVTIFGESAGAAAVHFLVLSPMAKGLFHKAIMQSGSATCPWAIGQKSFGTLARTVDPNFKNDEEALAKLQNIPIEELYTCYNSAESIKIDDLVVGVARPFVPVIENGPAEKCFINKDPLEIIKSGDYNKVPMIVGCTSKEGLFCLAFVKEDQLAEKYVMQHTLNLKENSDTYKKAYEKILDFYMNGKKVVTENTEGYVNLCSDVLFIIHVLKCVKEHVKNLSQPLYYYVFDMDTPINTLKTFFKVDIPGASHGDDLSYLFTNSLFNNTKITENSIEDKSIKKMVKMWTNFAKYSNPTPEATELIGPVLWNPATKDKFQYLHILPDLKMVESPLEENAVKFWEEITNMK